MSVAVIGVDPGSRMTGVVLRVDDALVWHLLLERSQHLSIYAYAGHVAVAVGTRVRPRAKDPAIPAVDAVAIEGVQVMGAVHRAPVIETAVVLGAVLGRIRSPYIVQPAGHGRAPLKTYPPEIVGEAETLGTGRMRHCRSAWDIAGAVIEQLREEERSA